MKRMAVQFSVAVCFTLVAAPGLARATTIGMDTDPLGNRADATVRFAYWDSFTQTQVSPPDGTTYTFNGVADGTSTLTALSLAQNTPHALGSAGSGLLIPTGGPVSDVYYSSTFVQNWTLQATAAINIVAMSFQIKTANVNESVIGQLFAPSLVGVGPATFHVGGQAGDPPIFGSFANYVIEYRWSGLNIAAGTPLEIQFAMAGGPSGNFTRKPVDFVSLDITSVPEPGSVVLLGFGAVIALCGLRRRLVRR